MPKLILRLLLSCLIFCSGGSLLAIDVPLKFTKITDDTDAMYSSGFRILNEDQRNRFREWKLPAFVDKNPLFGVTTLGNSTLLMVVDRRKPEDPYFNAIHLDQNNNRDLTDDKVVFGKLADGPDERLITVEFPAFDINIEVDGETFPYCLKASVMAVRRASPRFLVRIQSYCYYSGEFRHQGRKYHVALGDQTYNGRFDDRYEVQTTRRTSGGGIIARGDSFYISDSKTFEYYDSLGLGRWLVIGDELFEVSVDIRAGKMSLTPASGKLAALRLTAKPERLSLHHKDTDDFVMLYHPKEKVDLNPGWYCIYSYEVFKKDKSGDLWRLNAQGSSASPYVEAKARGAVMRLGEPYIPKVEVAADSRGRGTLLTFTNEGQGGEQVQELKRIDGNSTDIALSTKPQYSQRPQEPTYMITKLSGETVAQGSFEYG
jgi:hypothetical protein